jgi:hypothetical protein
MIVDKGKQKGLLEQAAVRETGESASSLLIGNITCRFSRHKGY